MLNSATERETAVNLTSSTETSTCSQLNTQLLNKGGHHLNQEGLREPQIGSAPKSEAHANFLADVKKALGAKKSAELFQAIYSYKRTDNYENLVTTVVSLFTEKDENFTLLVRFGMFIRPHHKMQYKHMMDALVGRSVSAADVPALNEEKQKSGGH